MQKRAEGGGMSLFLKGILIGLLFGVPVGAVGAMTVQRIWEHGIKAGLLTGTGRFKIFLSSFAVGIMNPAAILTFLFAFSWFGIAGGSGGKNGWLVVLGVFIGTYFWWGGLTAVVAFARRKKRTESFQKMNRIFGAVLSLFGILVFIRAIPR